MYSSSAWRGTKKTFWATTTNRMSDLRIPGVLLCSTTERWRRLLLCIHLHETLALSLLFLFSSIKLILSWSWYNYVTWLNYFYIIPQWYYQHWYKCYYHVLNTPQLSKRQLHRQPSPNWWNRSIGNSMINCNITAF